MDEQNATLNTEIQFLRIKVKDLEEQIDSLKELIRRINKEEENAL